MTRVTVADHDQFAQLPHEVQELAKRVVPDLNNSNYSDDLLTRAYREGWEDAAEELKWGPNDSDVQAAVQRLKKGA